MSKPFTWMTSWPEWADCQGNVEVMSVADHEAIIAAMKAEKLYRFHWRSGPPTEMRSAIGPEDALRKLGYGAGAVGALEYWECVTESPK